MSDWETARHPHGGGALRQAGSAIESARAAMILVHGRGGSAEDILSLMPHLEHPGVAYVAPQAAGNTWYPYSFMAPMPDNEPGLSSGLRRLAGIVELLEEQGLSAEQQILLGFSQGACLTLEFVARNAHRFGGVVGLTGGLIGPPGTRREYSGSLDGTPVLLGASDPDPHVPWARVTETAEVLEGLGGVVTLRRYPGMGHTIHPEELQLARAMLEEIARDETE